MATRMQQRRGTAAQWTAANPILAAGEIGFETDTNKFKMGNGSSTWSALQYFANAAELAAIIDGAPDLLNTLNELAASLGDDPTFFTTVASNLSAHASDTTSVHGIANTAVLVTTSALDSAKADAISTAGTSADSKISTHNSDTTNVHGIADTSALALTEDVTLAIGTHNSDTTNVHGIADTSALALTADVNDAITLAVSGHESLTQDVHGITDTANIVYTSDLNGHTGLTLNVHGIADTSDLITTSGLSAHTNLTQGVHGITDTADLVTTSMLADAVTPSALGYAGLAGTGLDYDSVNDALNIDSTVATKQYADDAVSTHNLDTTSVHGIADTAALATKTYVDGKESSLQTNIDAKAPIASPTFTGTVSGITKSMVGLGNVDNTTDANKPISTATQAALDEKAPLASPALTGTATAVNLTVSGNLTVNGTTTTVSSTNLEVTDPLIYIGTGNSANSKDLGVVGHFNDGTYQHTGLTRDASDGKWKLFSGVTTEPSDTIDFTTWTKDTLVLGSLEATTVTPSSGVVFSDGTQTKEGVPSRTAIVQKTAAYTLGSLTERDSLIEVSHTGGSAVKVTIPADSTLNFPIGTSIDVLQTNTGSVVIEGVAGVTVNATPGLTLRTQWSSATLFKRAANTWVVYGDLKA